MAIILYYEDKIFYSPADENYEALVQLKDSLCTDEEVFWDEDEFGEVSCGIGNEEVEIMYVDEMIQIK